MSHAKSGNDWVAFDKARNVLESIAESGVDSGMSAGGRDFWLRINGAEYFINMSRSKRQLAIDASVESKDAS